MPKDSKFNRLRAQSSMGTRWLWFYAMVLLFLHLLYLGVNTLSSLSSFRFLFDHALDAESVWTIILTLAYYGICFWLCLGAYIGISHFTKRGFKYNTAYLWLYSSLSILVQLTDGRAITPIQYGIFTGYIIWCVLNLAYFGKRRHLFGSAESAGVVSRFDSMRSQCSIGTRWLWVYKEIVLLVMVIFACKDFHSIYLFCYVLIQC